MTRYDTHKEHPCHTKRHSLKCTLPKASPTATISDSTTRACNALCSKSTLSIHMKSASLVLNLQIYQFPAISPTFHTLFRPFSAQTYGNSALTPPRMTSPLLRSASDAGCTADLHDTEKRGNFATAKRDFRYAAGCHTYRIHETTLIS